MSKLFTTILPSLLAGGLLFGSALTGAQPAPPAPPAPPPAAPAPAARAPRPPKIHVDLGDIDKMVDQQIAQALEHIEDNDQIPAQVRAKIKQRLEKVRVKVKQRLSRIDPTDLEALGDELGDMGDEIGDEMDDFGKEMEKWGKDFEKKMKSKHMTWRGPHAGVDVDVDLGDDDLSTFEAYEDDDDVGDAMKDLGDFKLAPGQRDQLRKLRAESDARVANAKRELDRASEQLRELLASGSGSDQEIARSIDNVTRLEGDIRKARILAWVNARRLLDDTQRKKIESAVRRSK
jgi:DNA repair exonuclease SbcCD ATPase subunit